MSQLASISLGVCWDTGLSPTSELGVRVVSPTSELGVRVVSPTSELGVRVVSPKSKDLSILKCSVTDFVNIAR